MTTQPARDLTIVSRSADRRPRTLRLEPRSGLSREAAYRRLAVAMLRLDVLSLANDLSAERSLPHAA
jgi:hypothetical protein